VKKGSKIIWESNTMHDSKTAAMIEAASHVAAAIRKTAPKKRKKKKKKR